MSWFVVGLFGVMGLLTISFFSYRNLQAQLERAQKRNQQLNDLVDSKKALVS